MYFREPHEPVSPVRTHQQCANPSYAGHTYTRHALSAYSALAASTFNRVAEQKSLNATNSTMNGADIDGQIVVSENLNFIFGVGYPGYPLHKLPSAPCTRQVPVPNSNLQATALYSCNVTGKSLETAPKYSFNIGGQYSITTEAGKFALFANYFRTDKLYSHVVNRLVQPVYGLLNWRCLRSWKAA